jgi:hypothetical protein
MAKQANRLAHEPRVGPSEIRLKHEDIAALAYAQWQEKGCPEGAHEVDWLRAERELTANPQIAVRPAAKLTERRNNNIAQH